MHSLQTLFPVLHREIHNFLGNKLKVACLSLVLQCLMKIAYSGEKGLITVNLTWLYYNLLYLVLVSFKCMVDGC